jgi:ABC-type spermidine/putrescine transport system permease subunit II/DNA-binding beta-propeller fold protein YncE
MLALMLWPLTFLFTLASWQKMESCWLESEPLLGGWSMVRWVLLPLAKTSLIQAAVLTLVLALNQFSVPAILQVKVLPAEIWVDYSATFNFVSAMKNGMFLVIPPLLMLLWFRHRKIGWPRLTGGASCRLFRERLGTPCWMASGVIAAGALAFSILPLLDLLASAATWRELLPAAAAGRSAMANSVALAAVASALTVALGLAGWRLPLGLVWWFFLFVPGVLLGIILITLFDRPPFLAFYQSCGIVIFAWVLRYLAFGWNGAVHARQSVDRLLVDAARVEGASGWALFRHVLWPQMAPQLGAVWYATYLLCLWDVETLVLIVPPGGETLALRVFNLLHYGHNSQVNALCAWLIALALLPLILWIIGTKLPFRAWGRLMRSGLGVPALAGQASDKSGRTAKFNGLAAACSCFGLVLLPGCFSNSSLESEEPLTSQVFNKAIVIGSRGTALGQFNKPRSLAVDAQDNLYVADMTGRVQKFDSNGVFLAHWQIETIEKGKPKGMDRDMAGNIIVVEPHYCRVNHFGTNGQLIARWGQTGTNLGQLAFPRSVAVNSSNEIYISEYSLTERVQRFTARGEKFIQSFGSPGSGNGQFNRPEGMGIGQSNRLFVADSCNHRIQVFTPDGQFLRAYGRAGSRLGEFSYPYDIRIDKRGWQYVCEFGNSRIQVFDDKDQPVETIGGAGSEPGKFHTPWSIAFDSTGNLYVADSGNHRVQKLIRSK